jgi:stage V sporulation protein B
MAVVPSRLRALGLGVHEATGLYGRLSGMAYPVIFVPTIFTAALAVSLVPAISEAQVSRPDWVRSRSSIALRLNLLVNVPAAVGLAVLAREVCALLYKVPEAGVPLFWLTPGIVFLSVQMISGAVLQGLGRSDLPVKHLVVGGLVKLALTWVLTGLPGLGIAGAAMATVIGYALNAYLNTRSAARLSGGSLGTLRLSVVPVLSSALMGLVVLATKPALARAVGAGMGALAAIAVGVLVYGLLVLMLGGLSGAELEMVPLAGPFLARILRRLRLVRR